MSSVFDVERESERVSLPPHLPVDTLMAQFHSNISNSYIFKVSSFSRQYGLSNVSVVGLFMLHYSMLSSLLSSIIFLVLPVEWSMVPNFDSESHNRDQFSSSSSTSSIPDIFSLQKLTATAASVKVSASTEPPPSEPVPFRSIRHVGRLVLDQVTIE